MVCVNKQILVENDMRPAVVAWLRERGCEIAHEILLGGYCDVTGIIYAPRTSRLIPAVERVIAIELKMRDIWRVVRQAENNKHFVDESYAAMPSQLCGRIRDKSKQLFISRGLGLISVDISTDQWSVIVVIPPDSKHTRRKNKRLEGNLWRAVQRQKHNGHE